MTRPTGPSGPTTAGELGESAEAGEASESLEPTTLLGERGESDCGWVMGLGWHGEHHRDQPCDESNTSVPLGPGS